jgi:hypothetical protein
MSVAIIATTTLRLTDLVIADHLQPELRRTEEFIQLAVVAARQLLENGPAIQAARTGIYLGTAFGPMAGNLRVLDDLVMGEPLSPTLFSHSVFNAAAGYIARSCHIHGPALTLTTPGWPFFAALQAARHAILAGTIDHGLVLQVETYSPLLADARRAMLAGPVPPWPAGAVAWLLGGRQGICNLGALLVEENDCPAEARLAPGHSAEAGHPLAAAEALSRLVGAPGPPRCWRQENARGKVELELTGGREK